MESARVPQSEDFSPFGLKDRLGDLEELGVHPNKVRPVTDVAGPDAKADPTPGASQEADQKASQDSSKRPDLDRRPSEMSVSSSGSVGVGGTWSSNIASRSNSSIGRSRKALGEALKVFGISRNPSLNTGSNHSIPLHASNTHQNSLLRRRDRSISRDQSATKRQSNISSTWSPGAQSRTAANDARVSVQSFSTNHTSRSRPESLRQSQEMPASPRQTVFSLWNEEAGQHLEKWVNNRDTNVAHEWERKILDVSEALDRVIEASFAYLSVLDAQTGEAQESETISSRWQEAMVLRQTVSEMSTPIRRLVQSCRHAIIGLPDIVLETIHDMPTQTPTEEHALSYLSSESLHPSQRRIVASLSKIVFFSHSAVGMDWPVPGCAEKLIKDTSEVMSSIDSFLSEVKRVGCLNPAGRGVKETDPTWGFNAVLLPRKQWRRLDEPALKAVQQLVSELDHAVSDSSLNEDGEEAAIEQEQRRMEELSTLVNHLTTFLRYLDVAATLDLEPTTPSNGEQEGSPRSTYSSLVNIAIAHKTRYDELIDGIRKCSSLLVWNLVNPDGGHKDQLNQRVNELKAVCSPLVSLLEEMASNATKQAEMVASGQLRGHIGRRSARVAERGRTARRVHQASSIGHGSGSALLPPPSPLKDSDSPGYYEADNESLRSQDLNSRILGIRASQTLTPGAAGGISASSSISNLSGMADMDSSNMTSSIRNSTANFMKNGIPFLRNRSGSEVDGGEYIDLCNTGHRATLTYSFMSPSHSPDACQ